jgi:hypothetical protein
MEASWEPPKSRRRHHVVVSDDEKPGSMQQIMIRSRSINPRRLLTSRRSAVRDRHRPLRENPGIGLGYLIRQGMPGGSAMPIGHQVWASNLVSPRLRPCPMVGAPCPDLIAKQRVRSPLSGRAPEPHADQPDSKELDKRTDRSWPAPPNAIPPPTHSPQTSQNTLTPTPGNHDPLSTPNPRQPSAPHAKQGPRPNRDNRHRPGRVPVLRARGTITEHGCEVRASISARE